MGQLGKAQVAGLDALLARHQFKKAAVTRQSLGAARSKISRAMGDREL
jgi:hypothetical protein